MPAPVVPFIQNLNSKKESILTNLRFNIDNLELNNFIESGVDILKAEMEAYFLLDAPVIDFKNFKVEEVLSPEENYGLLKIELIFPIKSGEHDLLAYSPYKGRDMKFSNSGRVYEHSFEIQTDVPSNPTHKLARISDLVFEVRKTVVDLNGSIQKINGEITEFIDKALTARLEELQREIADPELKGRRLRHKNDLGKLANIINRHTHSDQEEKEEEEEILDGASIFDMKFDPITLMDVKKHNIFISYSHQNKDILDRLQVHLDSLRYMVCFDYWSDRDLSAGDEWFEKIKESIGKATIAIFLISADFLASKFIQKEELPDLLEKGEREGLKIIPVIVSSCQFRNSPLGKYQAINDPAKPLKRSRNREEIYDKIVERIRSIING